MLNGKCFVCSPKKGEKVKPVRVAVLGSTRGTHLQNIADGIKKKELNAVVSAVISNKKDAFILERAKKEGFRHFFVNPKDFGSREKFDREISKIIDAQETDFVLLAGYMRILSPWFCMHYENRIINIHPSLLPDFAGGMDSDVHSQVLKEKRKETGCTLHFVTAKVDEGPVIFQEKVPVFEEDTPDTLKARVQEAEKKIIFKALNLFLQNKIFVKNGVVFFEN
jgi:phosphoribosylglycinamide formyltransferase 1